MVIARHRRRRRRAEPIRVGGEELTEQKNLAAGGPGAGAGAADTKLPSQYGKLFQLNRGIQIEFRKSPPAHPSRHEDDLGGFVGAAPVPSIEVSAAPYELFQLLRKYFKRLEHFLTSS